MIEEGWMERRVIAESFKISRYADKKEEAERGGVEEQQSPRALPQRLHSGVRCLIAGSVARTSSSNDDHRSAGAHSPGNVARFHHGKSRSSTSATTTTTILQWLPQSDPGVRNLPFCRQPLPPRLSSWTQIGKIGTDVAKKGPKKGQKRQIARPPFGHCTCNYPAGCK